MEIQCSRNFEKYKKGDPNDLQIIRGTDSQLTISCHKMKLLVPGLNYINENCLPKWSHGNPQTTHDVANTTGCFS